jgi:hypothetical protein
MKRTPRRGRIRLQSYIETPMGQRLEAFCAAKGLTEGAVVHAALGQYLDGTGDAALVMRRLDRLGRAGERTQRDLELVAETLALFVQMWLAHTPQLPEDARASARTSAHLRFQQFVTRLAEKFSGGHRFIDDLPREFLADEAELGQAASSTITETATPRRFGPTGT